MDDPSNNSLLTHQALFTVLAEGKQPMPKWLDLDFLLHAAALFFFAAGAFGLLYFTIRYPRRSDVRIWGTRVSIMFGFAALVFLVLAEGRVNDSIMMIFASLLFSLAGIEVSRALKK
ncbi:MAG: hypothetical protein ABIJ42_10375 [Acidobacteriota bacterium]